MSKKLELGLYRSLLTPVNLAFAKQACASHIVVHLVMTCAAPRHAGMASAHGHMRACPQMVGH